MIQRRVSPYVVVVIAVAFSSLSSLFIRLSTAPPIAVAAWRMLLSTAFVVPLALADRRAATPDDRDTASHPTRRHQVGMLLLSGLFLAAHFATWITSLQLTSVTHSTVLVTIHPVIVLVAGLIVLREPIGAARAIGAVGAIAGALILSLGGSRSGVEPTVAGDLLAFAGAVAVAGYLVIGRWARRTMGVWRYSLAVYAVAAVALVGLAAVSGVALGGYGTRNLVLFAALAFFCTILGHGLINWGLRFVPAGEVSMLILLEPVFATIMAVIWLGEIPGGVTIAGAVVVLASLGLVTRERRRIRSAASTVDV